MTRKGEIGVRQIKRNWLHRVELPVEAVRGPENSAATFGLAVGTATVENGGPPDCAVKLQAKFRFVLDRARAA
jgi:hypothetical protein